MIHGYVSVKTILARLYRELGSTVEMPETTVVELIADALAMIGSHYQYDEQIEILELEDGKAPLPNNFYKLINVRYQDQPLSWSTDSMINDYMCDECEAPRCCTEYNFYINNSFLITNIKELKPNNRICVQYLGVPVDEEGYPLVPDDIYFFKACVSYVTYILDYREWRKGNTPDKVMQKSERDWLFYVNAAKGSANMPSLSQLENLKNIMTRLIPSMNAYHNGFKNEHKQERLKRY